MKSMELLNKKAYFVVNKYDLVDGLWPEKRSDLEIIYEIITNVQLSDNGEPFVNFKNQRIGVVSVEHLCFSEKEAIEKYRTLIENAHNYDIERANTRYQYDLEKLNELIKKQGE